VAPFVAGAAGTHFDAALALFFIAAVLYAGWFFNLQNARLLLPAAVLRDPAIYLARETQHYDDIAWMNQHLDPARHRVGTTFKVIGYLTIPSLVLDPTRQLEIGPADLATPDRLLAACRRQGITHLFGAPDDFDTLRAHLRLLHANPASRLGGVRFFREPPAEATSVFEIIP
jgi:hypothetical protein